MSGRPSFRGKHGSLVVLQAVAAMGSCITVALSSPSFVSVTKSDPQRTGFEWNELDGRYDDVSSTPCLPTQYLFLVG